MSPPSVTASSWGSGTRSTSIQGVRRDRTETMPDRAQRTRRPVAPGQKQGPASPAKATDPRIFTAAYYARLNEVEAEHWWYRGIRGLASRWLAGELGGRVG